MGEKAKLIGTMLLAAILELIVYICLHEGGHALVSVACGAKITAFSIIGAYTSSVGGNFTTLTYSLLDIAGMVFPLIIAVCYMLFVFNKNKQENFYRLFSMFFSIVPIMSLVAWVMVPIAYMAGDTTSSDDVIKFLNVSGINPIIVMLISLTVFILIMSLAWKKGILKIWIDLVRGNTK